VNLGLLTLMEEHGFGGFENRLPGRMFGPKNKAVIMRSFIY
jgi:hypothetical protein